MTVFKARSDVADTVAAKPNRWNDGSAPVAMTRPTCKSSPVNQSRKEAQTHYEHIPSHIQHSRPQAHAAFLLDVIRHAIEPDVACMLTMTGTSAAYTPQLSRCRSKMKDKAATNAGVVAPIACNSIVH